MSLVHNLASFGSHCICTVKDEMRRFWRTDTRIFSALLGTDTPHNSVCSYAAIMVWHLPAWLGSSYFPMLAGCHCKYRRRIFINLCYFPHGDFSQTRLNEGFLSGRVGLFACQDYGTADVGSHFVSAKAAFCWCCFVMVCNKQPTSETYACIYEPLRLTITSH